MLIAKWQIDARFGHKQKVIDKLQSWAQEIAPQIGMRTGRLMTGSIGAREATVAHEWEVTDLAELDRAWSHLADIPAHKQWSVDLEPFVVSGSSHWEVYRVI